MLFLLAFVVSGAAIVFIARLPEDFSYMLGGLEVRPKHLQATWALGTLITPALLSLTTPT